MKTTGSNYILATLNCSNVAFLCILNKKQEEEVILLGEIEYFLGKLLVTDKIIYINLSTSDFFVPVTMRSTAE